MMNNNSKNITMLQAYDNFIEHGKTYWAPRTLTYYERNVLYFLRYLESECHHPAAEIRISDLPMDVLTKYVVWLRSKDKYSDHPLEQKMNVSGRIKSNTVNTYMRAVKSFFNYLFQNRYTDIRFIDGLKLPKSDDDQIIPLLCSEVARIDQSLDPEIPNDLRNLCIIHLMLDAGLRCSEVAKLTPGDLIFASGTIVINRSKGDKSRVVIMCPSLAAMLQEYITVFRPSGTLFSKSRENKPINDAVFKSLFLRLRRNTGIDRLHPHLLRHTFATSYIMGGGNLESLRILMGHYDYSVTRRYLHLAAQYQITGADIYQLDPVFFKRAY